MKHFFYLNGKITSVMWHQENKNILMLLYSKEYYDNFNKELANIVWDVLLCSNDRDKLGQI